MYYIKMVSLYDIQPGSDQWLYVICFQTKQGQCESCCKNGLVMMVQVSMWQTAKCPTSSEAAHRPRWRVVYSGFIQWLINAYT